MASRRHLVSAAGDDRPSALGPRRFRVRYAHSLAAQRHVLLPSHDHHLAERYDLRGDFDRGQHRYRFRALAFAHFGDGLHPELIFGAVQYPGRFVHLHGSAEYFLSGFRLETHNTTRS